MEHFILPSKRNRVRIVDIDGTILEKAEPENYGKVQPLPYALEIMNTWVDNGDYIILWTARPNEMRDFTVKQLAKFNVPYHELLMDKPYCHDIHIYDDNAITAHRVVRDIGLVTSDDITDEDIKTIPECMPFFPMVPRD